jgi:hypothetical protein
MVGINFEALNSALKVTPDAILHGFNAKNTAKHQFEQLLNQSNDEANIAARDGYTYTGNGPISAITQRKLDKQRFEEQRTEFAIGQIESQKIEEERKAEEAKKEEPEKRAEQIIEVQQLANENAEEVKRSLASILCKKDLLNLSFRGTLGVLFYVNERSAPKKVGR